MRTTGPQSYAIGRAVSAGTIRGVDAIDQETFIRLTITIVIVAVACFGLRRGRRARNIAGSLSNTSSEVVLYVTACYKSGILESFQAGTRSADGSAITFGTAAFDLAVTSELVRAISCGCAGGAAEPTRRTEREAAVVFVFQDAVIVIDARLAKSH